MSDRGGPIRDRFGTITLESKYLVLRRSPRLFFESQRARWRSGDRKNRLAAVCYLVWTVGLVLLIAEYVHLGLFAENPYMSGTYRILWLAAGVFAVGSIVRRFQSKRYPLEAFEDGVAPHGRQSIRLPRGALGRLHRIGRLGEQPKLVFVNRGHRDRALERFREVGIDVMSPDDDAVGPMETAATYRFLGGGGGYFCPECDARVSPSDRVCEACEVVLQGSSRTVEATSH